MFRIPPHTQKISGAITVHRFLKGPSMFLENSWLIPWIRPDRALGSCYNSAFITTIPSNSTKHSIDHKKPRDTEYFVKFSNLRNWLHFPVFYGARDSVSRPVSHSKFPPLSRDRILSYNLTPNFLILKLILNTILPHRTTSPKFSFSLTVSDYSSTWISYRPRSV
jgi:hypothetical protein